MVTATIKNIDIQGGTLKLFVDYVDNNNNLLYTGITRYNFRVGDYDVIKQKMKDDVKKQAKLLIVNKYLDKKNSDVIDDLRNESLITPYAYAALQGAFYEYQKNIVSVMRPFAASNEELNSDLNDLKRKESELEKEILQMELQLKKDGGVSAPGPIAPAEPEIQPEMFTGDTKTDGDKLVGEMLSQIKNIADEFGIKDALDALPEE